MNSRDAKSVVKDCINYGDVTIGGKYVGGIVADCNFNTCVGEITRCMNLGKITGTVRGSICGDCIGGKVTNCIYIR